MPFPFLVRFFLFVIWGFLGFYSSGWLSRVFPLCSFMVEVLFSIVMLESGLELGSVDLDERLIFYMEEK